MATITILLSIFWLKLKIRLKSEITETQIKHMKILYDIIDRIKPSVMDEHYTLCFLLVTLSKHLRLLTEQQYFSHKNRMLDYYDKYIIKDSDIQEFRYRYSLNSKYDILW